MNLINKKLFGLVLIVVACVLAINFTKAAAFSPFNQACSGAAAGNSTVCRTTNTSDPLIGPCGVITKVVNVVAVVGGIAAVVIILVAGIEFITSGGDPQRVNTAKNTLIYAIVGLIFIALSEIIVNFVLYNIAKRGS